MFKGAYFVEFFDQKLGTMQIVFAENGLKYKINPS